MFYLLAVAALCIVVGVEADIVAVPNPISVPSIRQGVGTSFEVWIHFTGNDTLKNINDEGSLVGSFATVKDEMLRLPRGLDGYLDDMCVQPCVTAVNTTSVRIELQYAPFFDLRLDQELRYSVTAVHFNDFRSRDIPIIFARTEATVTGASYGVGVPFQVVDTISLLFFPGLHDSRTVLAYVSSSCITVEQMGWLPGSVNFLSVFGGETVFSQAWKFFVACGSVLTIIIIALLVTRSNQLSLLLSRVLVPLILVQLACFFLPSLIFDAGFMVSYGPASHQVFAAFILIYMGVTTVASYTVWMGDRLRRYMLCIVESHALPPRARFLTRTSGQWLTPRFSFLTYRDEGSNWMVFPERLLLPSYLAQMRRDKVLVLLCLHVVSFLMAGIQMGTPTLCFMQAYVLSFLHFVMCVWIAMYVKFRNTPIRAISALLHLNSALMLGMLASFPSSVTHALFLTGAGVGLVLGLVRLVIWGFILFRQDAIRSPVDIPQSVPPVLAIAEPNSEGSSNGHGYGLMDDESDYYSEGDGGGDSSNGDEERGYTPIHMVGSTLTPLVRSPTVLSEKDTSEDEKELASTEAIIPTEVKRTPKYLLNASTAKPKPRREERLRVPEPMWFPADRPEVRTTDDPDNELKLAPYRIRKT